MRRHLPLALLALLTLLAAAPLARAAVNLAAVPIGRMDLPWWRARFERSLTLIHQKNPELVWLGDSITQNWERSGPPAWRDFHPIWRRYYARYRAVNLGFIGDDTASVIWRLDHGEVAGISPRVVILLIGANNLGAPHWGARRTVPGIETVIEILHRKLPRAKVLLLGVLPSRRSAWITAQTRAINAALAPLYANSPFVTFMDVNHVLEKNGHIDPSLYVEGHLHPTPHLLHPDAQGMERIAATIEPTLQRLMAASGTGP